MSTTWNGNYTPAQDDMWNLVEDMRKHAILNNRVIPVFSKAERDGLTDSAPDGVMPEGTVVVRVDQANKGAVFDVYANGKWNVGDTGILTSGVNVQAGPNFKVESYSMVRTGSRVTARIDLSYSGADIETQPMNGNTTDTTLFTLESAWAPVWATYDISLSYPGISQWFGRVDSNGVGSLTHGLPGNTFKKTHGLRMDGSWRIA